MNYDDPRWYDRPENKPSSQPFPPDAQFAQDDEHTLTPADPQQAGTSSPTAQQFIQYTLAEEKARRRRRIIGQVIVTLGFMVVAFAGGWFAHQTWGQPVASSQSQKYANLIQQAWSTIDQNYVDRKAVNYQQMSYDAIKAMITDLGDTGHTRFMTAAEVKSEQQSLSGSFAGIGVYVQQDATTKDIKIISTIDNAPAQKAGIKAGDIIIAVNGTNVVGKEFSTVQPMIEGTAGTQVTLTIKRGDQTLTFTVTRANITVPNVEMHYIAQDHIAHIQIVQFATGVSDQLKAAILQAKKDGATKIILDLRNNPGGYLQEAIDTASEFMASGTVLIEQDSQGHQTKYAVSGSAVDTKIPMLILINGNTASAAEIVAGALQDDGRSMIMGTQSFGTGTVLQEYDLSDGSAILLGVDEWLTPKGHFIRKDKIQPSTGLKVDLTDPTKLLTPDVETQNNMSLN